MNKLIAFATGAVMLATAMPALASWYGSSSDITIGSTNNATVSNNVNTQAYTGSNIADGGRARSSAAGKNATSYATGGAGGTVVTGDAWASTRVTNDVNNNYVSVTSPCNCSGDVDVWSGNNANVGNSVGTVSDTGMNATNGGNAKSRATGSSQYSFWSPSGSAVSGAVGGDAGTILTGGAGSQTKVTNLVNTNVTRVRR